MEREEVLRVARLARLELTEEDIAQLAEELGRILEHVARIQSLDTDAVEATRWVDVEPKPLRPDEVRPSLPREAALANAPRVRDGLFQVPRVGEDL